MRLAIGFLLLLASAIPLALSDNYADGLRWSGMFYQLSGLLMVVIGVMSKPRALGLPTLPKRWWAILVGSLRSARDRILGRKPPGQVIEVPGTALGVSTGRARSMIGGTPEKRLDHLEEIIKEQDQLISEVERKIEKAKKDAARDLRDERTSRQQALRAIEAKVREATLGDTGLELFGVLLIWVGIVMSALAGGLPFGLHWPATTQAA